MVLKEALGLLTAPCGSTLPHQTIVVAGACKGLPKARMMRIGYSKNGTMFVYQNFSKRLARVVFASKCNRQPVGQCQHPTRIVEIGYAVHRRLA